MLWGEATHPTVWLKNHTPMKVLEGDMTPYKVAYGKKPNLHGVHEWGSHCCVRNKLAAKLGGQVSEGIWVGLDKKSKGAPVYWLGCCTVTAECNIYFDKSAATCHLEGKDLVIVEAPPAPITLSSTVNCAPTPVAPAMCLPPPPPPNNPPCQPHIWKLSQHIQDLMCGIGITSNHQMDPKLTQGVQPPTLSVVAEPGPAPAIVELVKLEGVADLAGKLMDLDDEFTMLTKVAEVKALEPSSLAEVKCCLD